MTTPLQAVGGHEVCPQCQYPHMATGQQRCVSCGWARGSEIAPRVGRPYFDVRANALASLLPGDPGVSIEQRIQAQQAVPDPPPPPPPPPEPEPLSVAAAPEPKFKLKKPTFLQ